MNPLESYLERPLCVFDIESTGTEVATDRIISLTAMKIMPPELLPQYSANQLELLCNPVIPIPASSTRIHGIRNEDVVNLPYFETFAPQVHDFIKGCDLCGFNIRNFDVPLLWEEFERSGIAWDLTGIKLVDASEIFRRKEPRNLTAAVKKYCHREHTSAHNATADVKATWDVLQGQRLAYEDIAQMNVAALAEFSNSEEWEGQPAKRLDLSGLIIETADGVARYTLKKVRGVAVVDDPSFGGWMLRNSFPENTKRVLRSILQEEFV